MRYFLGICLIIFFGCVQKLENKKVSSGTIQLFQNNMVHFSLVDSINAQYETIRVSSQDNGREIMTQAELPHGVSGRILRVLSLRQGVLILELI